MKQLGRGILCLAVAAASSWLLLWIRSSSLYIPVENPVFQLIIGVVTVEAFVLFVAGIINIWRASPRRIQIILRKTLVALFLLCACYIVGLIVVTKLLWP